MPTASIADTPAPKPHGWQALWYGLVISVLYFLTGKLGLTLSAISPYSTVIWPPSGIAVGLLLLWGGRFWPAVLLGSFVLNLEISHALTLSENIPIQKVVVALIIAIGSTLQAHVARWLVARQFGQPVRVNALREVALVAAIAGPMVCLIAATVGNIALLTAGIIPFHKLWSSWLTWWAGDTLGVLLIAPLVLLLPARRVPIIWQGKRLNPTNGLAIVFLSTLLFASLFAWRLSLTTARQESEAVFLEITKQSQRTLQRHLDKQRVILEESFGPLREGQTIGAASLEAWLNAIAAHDLQHTHSSLSHIGFLPALDPEQMSHPLSHEAIHGASSSSIFVNGFDLSARPWLIDTMQTTRRRGATLLTSLEAQFDGERKANDPLLLITPVYSARSNSVFLGWGHATLDMQGAIQSALTYDLRYFRLRIHNKAAPSQTLYDSQSGLDTADNQRRPQFSHEAEIDSFGHTWILRWESTVAFEADQHIDKSPFVLVGGLLITGTFAAFAALSALGKATAQQNIKATRYKLVPLGVFALIFGGGITLAVALRDREENTIRALVEAESSRVEVMLIAQISDQLHALQSMARRWQVFAGADQKLWQADAKDQTNSMTGLREVLWLDSRGQAIWRSDGTASGNTSSDQAPIPAAHLKLLSNAPRSHSLISPPPFTYSDVEYALFLYMPVVTQGQETRFLAWRFDLSSMFALVVTNDFLDNFGLRMSHADKIYFDSQTRHAIAAELPKLKVTRGIQLNDQNWHMALQPTRRFVDSRREYLPIIELIASLIIGSLAALSVRFAMVHRARAESLNSTSQLNNAILSSIPHLIISTDAQGIVQTFNKAAESTLGYTAEEVIGRTTPAIWHDAQEVQKRAQELTEELGETIQPGFDVFVRKAVLHGSDLHEWTFIRKNGSRFSVSLSASPMYTLNGEISGYVGVIEDITERLAQQEVLKTSEETFRSAMEHASIGMALVDPRGRWLKVNAALCDLLGYEDDTLLINDVQSIAHHEDLPQFQQELERACADETSTFQMEMRLYHVTGKLVWVLLSMSLVHTTDGKPRYFVAQLHDITARMEMDRVKDEFISVISHELRTPLTSIRGSLGLITGTMSREVSDRVARLIQIANSNCERLILLINDILDIDKIVAGEMRFECREECLATIIQQTEEANRALAIKSGTLISVDELDTEIRCVIDSPRLVQVLTNFVCNAVKFSPAGAHVDVRLTQRDGWARISVVDHGAGIPEEFRSRIFGKFSQADSTVTRNKGGTGLGLHISKMLVEHMGGRIGFDSQVGLGSTFWVEFPLAISQQDASDEDEHDDVAHFDSNEEHATTLPLVLHVEDDPDLCLVLKTALHGKANVISAPKLSSAERWLQQRHFDAIVLDISLPDGSGMKLLDELAERHHAGVPVMILSAADTDKAIQDKVKVAMVKSRVSETLIVDTIMKLVGDQDLVHPA